MHRSFLHLIIVIVTIWTITPAQAQTAEENKTYVVSADQLTPGQIAALEAGEKLETMETVGEYAGMGREIGEGVSEALGALSEETQKFGETKVGHFTMAMIAWKIMGDDIIQVCRDMVGYFVGIPFLFIGLSMVTWSYRRACTSHTVLTRRGKGFFLFAEKTYDEADPDADDVSAWAIGHLVALAAVTLVGSLMIF